MTTGFSHRPRHSEIFLAFRGLFSVFYSFVPGFFNSQLPCSEIMERKHLVGLSGDVCFVVNERRENVTPTRIICWMFCFSAWRVEQLSFHLVILFFCCLPLYLDLDTEEAVGRLTDLQYNSYEMHSAIVAQCILPTVMHEPVNMTFSRDDLRRTK